MSGAPVTPLHVALLVEGAPGRPPIVALHGFTGDGTTWGRFAEAWRAGASRPTLLAVDLVGHGRSPDPNDPAAYRLDAQVASVCAALDGLGVSRAIWLGYSMGGRIALAAAVARAERVAGLVLVSASPGLADDAERAARAADDAALAGRIEADGVEAFVDDWAAHPLFATQARLGAAHAAAARAQRLGNRAAALAHSLREAGAGAMTPLWGDLGTLAMPTLIVTGALDAKYDRLGRAMAGAMTGVAGGARNVVVAGAGHAVLYEAPSALAGAVHAWLDEIAP